VLELAFPGCAGDGGDLGARLAGAGAVAWVTLQLGEGPSPSGEPWPSDLDRHVVSVDWPTLTRMAAAMGLAATASEAGDGRLDARHWLFVVDRAGRVRSVSDGEDADRVAADLRAPASETARRLVAFSGSDQDGRPVTAHDFLGHALVADFIFTRCEGACPMLTARLAVLRRMVTAPDVRFVSFSVDPAYDTPAVLKAYAARWGARDERWRLLALDAPSVRAVARALGQVVRDDGGGPIVHSDRFVLIDATGAVRESLPSGEPTSLRRLADALRAPPPGASAGETGAAAGARLFSSLGCRGCHDDGRVAPRLPGVAGRRVRLADGRTVAADDGYLRESIVSPLAEVVEGFGPSMPSYAGLLSDGELASLVAYLQAL